MQGISLTFDEEGKREGTESMRDVREFQRSRPKTREKKYVEIACVILRHTDKAIMISDDGGENEHWLPKSLCRNLQGEILTRGKYEMGRETTIEITEWIAAKEGIF